LPGVVWDSLHGVDRVAYVSDFAQCVPGTRIAVLVESIPMNPKHASAPLLESILGFVDREQAPFYSPGHKGGRTFPREFTSRLAEMDLNNLPDTDTLHCPTGGILAAQELLADAYGVDHSYLLVGGSTAGNIAALMTTLSPGDSVLVQRNAHKSVIAGIIHSGARPVWLAPAIEERFGLALGLATKQVEDALDAEPGAKALVALNPTYFGTTPDIAQLGRVCRDRGLLLLADEAHGPHFHFHDELPLAAEDAGADTVVQSIHKILSGLSQAAVLHTRGLDPARVQKVLQLIQTTSPSFPIMASIDFARRQMVVDGARLLGDALALARRGRRELAAIPGLEVLGREHVTGPSSGFFDLDETKIVVRVEELGLTGYEVQRILNRDFGVQPELGGTSHVLFILTIGNDDRDVDRMVAAMRSIASNARGGSRAERASSAPATAAVSNALLAIVPKVEMTPRDAFYAKSRAIDFASAAGHVCAEVVTPYPPGIPTLMPGERITREILTELARVRDAGCPISSSDPTLGALRVVS